MNEEDMIRKLGKLHADGVLSDEELKRIEGAVHRDAAAQWEKPGPPPESGQSPHADSGEDLIRKLERRRDEGTLTDADFAEMQEVVRRDESARRRSKSTSKKAARAGGLTVALLIVAALVRGYTHFQRQEREAAQRRQLQEQNQRLRGDLWLQDGGRTLKTADGGSIRLQSGRETWQPNRQPSQLDFVSKAAPSVVPSRGTGAPWEKPPSATGTLLPWEQPSKAGKPIAGTAAAKPTAPQPGKEESKKFLGTWQCVSRTSDGKKETKEEVEKLTWVLRAGGYFNLLREGKLLAEGVVRDVDPAKTPKTLSQWIPVDQSEEDEDQGDKDAVPVKYDGNPLPAPSRGNIYLGIYRFDGDTLEVCTVPADKERPAEFASKPGSAHVHAVWRRVAPAKDVDADPPATWWMRQVMRKGVTGAKDVPPPVKRPSPERVARRAMVLALVTYRASLEQFPGQPKFEALHGRLPAWVEQIGLASELEKAEHDFLRAPLGKANEKVALNSEWRIEGLGVLAWALKRYDLPPHDELTDPRKAVASVGLSDEFLSAMDTAAAKKLFRDAELRPASEIDRFASHITIVNWRVRTYRLAGQAGGADAVPKRMDFVGYLRAHPSFKESWLKGLRLVGNDLAVGDKAIGDAPPDEVRKCGSIAVERQIAAYWLQGDDRVYSKVDAPTILFGLE